MLYHDVYSRNKGIDWQANGSPKLSGQKLSIEQCAKSLPASRSQAGKQRNQIINRVSETKSWTKSYKDRKLGGLVEQLQKDDILLISELSRLGRSLFEVMEIQ